MYNKKHLVNAHNFSFESKKKKSRYNRFCLINLRDFNVQIEICTCREARKPAVDDRRHFFVAFRPKFADFALGDGQKRYVTPSSPDRFHS